MYLLGLIIWFGIAWALLSAVAYREQNKKPPKYGGRL